MEAYKFDSASGLERIFARVLDSMLYIPLFLWYFFISKGVSVWAFVGMLTVFLIFLEVIIPLMAKGSTVGKMIMGLRTISEFGGEASLNDLTDKCFFYILILVLQPVPLLNGVFNVVFLFFLVLSLFLMFGGKYNQGVLDKLCSVIVVRSRKHE